MKKNMKIPFIRTDKNDANHKIINEPIKEIIVERNSGFSIFEVFIIVLMSLVLGIIVGVSISAVNNRYKGIKISSSLQNLIATYDDIVNNYYQKVDEKKLVDEAIKGMVTSLNDPHSNYLDKNTTEVFNETVDGNYTGIGVTVGMNENDEFIILQVVPNSPAKKADVKVWDKIIKINQKEVKGLSIEEVSDMIKKAKNNKVKLTLLRDEKLIEKSLTLGKVDLISVTSKVFTEDSSNIGYIYIKTFAANTYQQFIKELKKLEKHNIQSLILDVRSNPGGHLSQAKEILEIFMKKNQILYQTELKKKTSKIKDDSKEFREYPIAILINSSSASASEVLAASFRENYKDVTLVGETSYGKGTVQTVYSLVDGSTLKYTVERWLTPKGNWIDGKGVVPDFEVLLTEEYFKNPIANNDYQLQKAIEILKNKNTSKN